MRFGVALVLVVLTFTCAHASTDPPPNIVLIISDDQCYTDFGFMGNRRVRTPHIDRLAEQSARYVNAYVPSSVCSPSLATMLTGLYPHQNGIHYNHPPPGNPAFNRMTSIREYMRVRSRAFTLIREVDTLPRLLRDHAGYRSLQTGKFWEGHYSNAGFTEGMTVFQPVPGQEFGGNRRLASGEFVAHGNGDAGLQIGRRTMQPIDDFLDDVVEQPFLIWYAPYLPHQPHDSPQKYYDLYADADIPEHHIPYYASISQFDETVGRLVDQIESRGLASNTLFLFVVDNGWEPSTNRAPQRPAEFNHTKRSKRAPFDFGLRTPILIRWDGHVTAATHSELVNSIDIVPTLLGACGLGEHAKDLPGIDLLPSARGEEKLDPDRAIFGEVYPGDASSLRHPERDVAYRWVRRGPFKLIVSHAHGNEHPWNEYLMGDALYNLNGDPEESHNLIDDAAHFDTVEQLRELLNAWWNPQDDSPSSSSN